MIRYISFLVIVLNLSLFKYLYSQDNYKKNTGNWLNSLAIYYCESCNSDTNSILTSLDTLQMRGYSKIKFYFLSYMKNNFDLIRIKNDTMFIKEGASMFDSIAYLSSQDRIFMIFSPVYKGTRFEYNSSTFFPGINTIISLTYDNNLKDTIFEVKLEPSVQLSHVSYIDYLKIGKKSGIMEYHLFISGNYFERDYKCICKKI